MTMHPIFASMVFFLCALLNTQCPLVVCDAQLTCTYNATCLCVLRFANRDNGHLYSECMKYVNWEAFEGPLLSDHQNDGHGYYAVMIVGKQHYSHTVILNILH